jgi:hypothetical protein
VTEQTLIFHLFYKNVKIQKLEIKAREFDINSELNYFPDL